MHLDTLCLHGGQVPDPATNARAAPVYRTTSFPKFLKQPPFPRPPVRPDGWFRGLPSEANS